MRRFHRRRLIRLHLEGDKPSIEGVFVGYEAGHYLVANARMILDAGDHVPLEGEAWVPRERVLYVQRLS
jgi:hypothetical protein